MLQQARVKWVSRGLAFSLAACACALLFLDDAARLRRAAAFGEPQELDAVSVEITQRPVERRRQSPAPLSAIASSSSNNTPPPVLWNYDAEGQIVFATQAQFFVCTQARRENRDQADCPSRTDRRAYRAPEADALVVSIEPRWTTRN